MLSRARGVFAYSGFVFLGLVDLGFRVFLAERQAYTCNIGGFWGITLPQWFMLPSLIFLLGFLMLLLCHSYGTWVRFSLVLMLVGGSVNLMDRLSYGCVLDYWAWPGVAGALFPNFNLADMLLLLGLTGLGWTYLNRSQDIYASQGFFWGDTRSRRGTGRD